MIFSSKEEIDYLVKINNYLWELSICLKKQYKRVPFAYYFLIGKISYEIMNKDMITIVDGKEKVGMGGMLK